MSDKDIVCEDADGDGYYFWGLRPKPASCPPGVSNEPDGDDSDPMAGPMDKYGYLESLDPAKRDTILITSENNNYARSHVYNHIIVDNTTWTISSLMTFHNGAKVTVKNGATLIVTNGAVLKDICLTVEKGAHIIVNDQSILKMHNANEFFIPVGATLDLNGGTIE